MSKQREFVVLRIAGTQSIRIDSTPKQAHVQATRVRGCSGSPAPNRSGSTAPRSKHRGSTTMRPPSAGAAAYEDQRGIGPPSCARTRSEPMRRFVREHFGAHDRRRIFVHLVWGTWDRAASITPTVEHVAFGTISARARRLRSEVLAIEGVSDHTHVSRSPQTDVTTRVRAVKSASTVKVHRTISEAAHFKWQHGCAALTISPQDAPALIRTSGTRRRITQTRALIRAGNRLWTNSASTTDRPDPSSSMGSHDSHNDCRASGRTRADAPRRPPEGGRFDAEPRCLLRGAVDLGHSRFCVMKRRKAHGCAQTVRICLNSLRFCGRRLD